MKKITWGVKELIKMYSSQDSFFSKKRIESGIAFIIAEYGLIHYLAIKISTMSTGDIVLWAAANFAVAGYSISKIQEEKKTKDEKEPV